MPKRYRAQPGDCISSIAYAHGFLPDTLWNAPENDALREARRDGYALATGDEVFIPDLRRKTVTVSTGRSHRFRRLAVPERLRVQLLSRGEPRAGVEYVLEVDGSPLARGRTSEDGRIEAAISPTARRARLLLHEGLEIIELALGHLEPVDRLEGVQQRLQALGLYAGPVDGELTHELELAVIELQIARGIEPTGELDQATREALLEATGGMA